jgi:predicted Zn-dependent peptidase
MELAADVLRHPSFDEKEVALIKEVSIASIAQGKTNPSTLAGKYIDAVLYEGHAYGGMPATAEDVAAVTEQDLRDAYKRRVRPQDLTLYVVGGIDPDELIKTLDKHFGNWKPGSGEAEVADVMSMPANESPSRVIVFDVPGAPQSNVIAAQVIDPPYQAGHDDFGLANMIYGGNFTSRINANLREEKGWSYGVRSSIDNVAGPRTWRITAQVQTDKTAESITELLEELRAVNGDKPFAADELEKVRNERIRKLPAVTATTFGILGYLAENGLYGRADDYVEQRKADYEAVKLENLAPALNARVDPDKLTWFISGDLAKIEEDVAALNLGEMEVWDTDGKRVR